MAWRKWWRNTYFQPKNNKLLKYPNQTIKYQLYLYICNLYRIIVIVKCCIDKTSIKHSRINKQKMSLIKHFSITLAFFGCLISLIGLHAVVCNHNKVCNESCSIKNGEQLVVITQHNHSNDKQQPTESTTNQDADDDECKSKYEMDDCITPHSNFCLTIPSVNIKRLHKNSNIKEVSISIVPPPPLLNS